MERLGLSIIVPVYNVEGYLEQCLQSICNQITMFEYEVVLVNDGATDRSGEICSKWAEKYKQIRYYEKQNEGLGPTRNFGMSKSVYKYITFVDSDDWIHESFVEKMVSSIVENDADIVYCDCYYYSHVYQSLTQANFRSNLQNINAGVKERMAYGYPNMWGAVYKKELWLKNDLGMPGIIYEDTAVYGVLLAYADKICCVKEALYYYRMGRSGSLMQIGSKEPKYMVNALDYLMNLAGNKRLLDNNRETFLDFCIRQLEVEWDNNLRRKDESQLREIRESFKDFLDVHFPQWEYLYCQNAVAIGSYNASAVYNRIKMFREISQDKYQFSGLISIVSDPVAQDRYTVNDTSNMFRLETITKEVGSNILEEIGRDKVIILDFMDELNDVIKIENSYLNKSDALFEVINLYGELEIIPRHSKRCYNLWENACREFVDWARKNHNQIVLLKLNLCKEYGDEKSRKEFSYQTRIAESNSMLQQYYNYFESICPECLVVELNSYYQFTEEKFRFGCKPYYYNSFAYFLLAYETLRKVRGWKKQSE